MILNKKVFVLVFVSLLLVGGVVFLFWGSLSSWLYPENFRYEKDRTFWVEVITPEVVASRVGSPTPRILRTGDEVREGATIEVKKGGAANLYFPDGSVARLDSETRVVVHSALFKKDKNVLTVSLELVVGRVWSKVVSLITPESLWEVRTSNAVAVVRGTAFGVEYTQNMKKGVTRVIGGKNSVTLGVLDPKTKKLVKADVGVITPNTYTEITDDIVEEIKEHEIRAPQLIIIRKVPTEILNQPWIKNSVEQDRVLDKKSEKLRSTEKEVVTEIPPAPYVPKEIALDTSEQRNKKRRTDVNIIWDAINRNSIDGSGVFGGVGAKSCIGLRLPTEMNNIAKADFGQMPNFDLSCLIPKYLDRMPLDPDSGHRWNSADDYFTGYQVFFDQSVNEAVVFSARAEQGERIYKGGSGSFLLPGDEPFVPGLPPPYTP